MEKVESCKWWKLGDGYKNNKLKEININNHANYYVHDLTNIKNSRLKKVITDTKFLKYGLAMFYIRYQITYSINLLSINCDLTGHVKEWIKELDIEFLNTKELNKYRSTEEHINDYWKILLDTYGNLIIGKELKFFKKFYLRWGCLLSQIIFRRSTIRKVIL